MIKKIFAFVVHSRDRNDLPRKYPILKYLPKYIFDKLTLLLPPFVVSKITGLINKDEQKVDGILIGIPMTAHQLIENKKLALKKIIYAIKLAEKKGVKYIGLGAMTSSLSRGGLDIIDISKNIYITTGKTYTVKNIVDYVLFCTDYFKLNKEKVKIGIVGAAGGIGSGVLKLLALNGYNLFILIDLERKLDILKDKITKINLETSDVQISISHQVNEVINCDIIIAATNAPEVVIRSEDVSPGTIIINDAQPSDISPDILINRKDVLVIEGGVLSTENINCNFNMGLSGKNDIFSCLAETLLLAYNSENKHYSINDLDVNFVNELSFLGRKLGFNINRIQNSLGIVSNEYLTNFSYNIEKRRLK